MAVGTFVGVGPCIYNGGVGSGGWQLPFVVGSNCLPSGARTNDFLILYVYAGYSETQYFIDPQAPRLVGWGDDIDSKLGLQNKVSNGSGGTTSTSIVSIFTYVGILKSDTFPITLTPVNQFGATFVSATGTTFLRVHAAVARPFYFGVNSGSLSTSFWSGNLAPTSPYSVSAPPLKNALAIQVTSQVNGFSPWTGQDLGPMVTPNGFTERGRFDSTNIGWQPGFGGSIVWAVQDDVHTATAAQFAATGVPQHRKFSSMVLLYDPRYPRRVAPPLRQRQRGDMWDGATISNAGANSPSSRQFSVRNGRSNTFW